MSSPPYIEEAGLDGSTGEVARLVTELFRDRREELQRIVEEQMDEAREPPSSRVAARDAPIASDDNSPARVDRSRSSIESAQTPRSIDSKAAKAAESAIVATGDALPPPAPPRSRIGGVIALSAVVVAALGVFALSRPKPVPESKVNAVTQSGRCVLTIAAGAGLAGHPLMFQIAAAADGCKVSEDTAVPPGMGPPGGGVTGATVSAAASGAGGGALKEGAGDDGSSGGCGCGIRPAAIVT